MNANRCFSAALMICFLFSSWFTKRADAIDGHIDDSSRAHRHSLTISRHADTIFGAQTAIAGANYATRMLQVCDRRVNFDQDVPAAVAVDVVGGMDTFGTAGDGGDIVADEAHMMALLNEPTRKIKVVSQILWCGDDTTAGTIIAGCAAENSSMVIAAGLGVETTGLVVVHELGHIKGLGHRGDSGSPPLVGNPIMKAEGADGTEVNLLETVAYHTGGSDDGPNRPIDSAIFVDTTGSMTEEIQSVKDALTSWVDSFPAELCAALQLTTFKDDVTEYDPTTEPTHLRSQVSALSAAGGDACPEASLEAINQVKDRIRDGGQIVIATDASPYSDVDLGPTITSLVGRGISVHVMLSGDCAATGLNNDGTFRAASSAATPSSVQFFSELAERTGGMFAYVPEVNDSVDGARRYAFASYNILQASTSPAIALANPGSIPAGASATIVFRGAHTNFRSGTTLSVAGGGVTVQEVTVRSPLELIATLRVDAGATLGFRDISVVTESETARGIGALQIAPAVALPTITSITASSARPGETVRVTVLGVNTHFAAGSTLSVGSSISISALQVLSPTVLQATLAISPSAIVGFRDVRVTTGGEIATETLTGPFFVAPNPTGGVPQLTAVVPSSVAPGATRSLTLTGSNTSFVQGTSIVSFGGTGVTVQSVTVQSPNQLVASVTVASNAPLGFQDVRVTTGAEVAAAVNGILIGGGGPPSVITPVPGLSPLVLMLFAFALAIVALHVVRRRRV